MTKKEYIDWIRNNLAQIDETAKYHPKQVEYAIENVFNQIYYDIAVKTPMHIDRYSTLVTGIDTHLDSTTGRYTASLSKVYVDLPFKTSGVLEVRDPSSPTLAFVPMTNIEMDQAYGADMTLGSSIIGFSARNGFIDFFGMAEATDGLTVRIIQKFSEFVHFNNIYPPYGKDFDIITMVSQMLSSIPPKDLINNNSDISYGKQE